MPVKIEYHKKQNYVAATITGKITLELAKETIGELLPVLEKTGCKHLLTDSTQGSGEFSTMEIMQFPKMLAASQLTAELKQAAVIAERSIGGTMYETFSKMQGLHMAVFTDRAQAMEWLLADEE